MVKIVYADGLQIPTTHHRIGLHDKDQDCLKYNHLIYTRIIINLILQTRAKAINSSSFNTHLTH